MKKSNTQTKKSDDTIASALRRYRDIEAGKVLPTLQEFFKICIIYGIGENVNLKELYPTLYRDLKEEIDMRSKQMQNEKSRKK